VASGDFVLAVAVQIDGAWLVGGSRAARIVHVPEQFAPVIVRVDIMIAVLDENIGGAAPPREIGEDDTVSGVLGNRDAAPLGAGAAVQFHEGPLGGEDNFGAAVAVPVMDLAGDVVVPLLAADVGIAPAPQHTAVQALGDGGRGVVNVADVVVFAGDEVNLAVRVQIGTDHPLAPIVRIERDSLPWPNGGDISRGRPRVVGIEEQGLGSARSHGNETDDRCDQMLVPCRCHALSPDGLHRLFAQVKTCSKCTGKACGRQSSESRGPLAYGEGDAWKKHALSARYVIGRPPGMVYCRRSCEAWARGRAAHGSAPR